MRKKMQSKTNLITAGLLAAVLLVACEKSNRSYSLLAEQQNFKQNANSYQQRKVDILWVVDNSGSMQSSQANLVSNFNSFIQRFQTLGFDYHMAVIGSDAYLGDAKYLNDPFTYYRPDFSLFRDGSTDTYGFGHSNIFVMNPQNTTADIFKKNISISTNGYGDERAFSSFVTSLSDSRNAAYGFRRPDAFLSVIILSDEDDFSGDATNLDHFNPTAANYVGDHNYAAPAPYLQPVDYYVNWLDQYAGGRGNYSVSAIYTDTAACKTQLDAGNGTGVTTSRIIGQRYAALADRTGGTKGSLCSNFGVTLNLITNSVLELASTFKLDREPLVSSINVIVDGVSIANSSSNGWTYDAATMSVMFHGTSVPKQDANIIINYDPITVKH